MFRDMQCGTDEDLTELGKRVSGYDRKIRNPFRNNGMCQRFARLKRTGPILKTALVAALGDRFGLKYGRRFAAWLELVPLIGNSTKEKSQVLPKRVSSDVVRIRAGTRICSAATAIKSKPTISMNRSALHRVISAMALDGVICRGPR
ncbi:MAG: hypothetical protein NXH97_13615 [Rhodobacteraceae bacterium]|nr:hypothetical protein [Paracoccaceae bacterium]